MKILFIFPDVNSFHKLYIHFGIGYIATVLRAHGYKNVKFLSVSDVGEYEGVIRSVLSFKPDIVGFSSVETQFNAVTKLSLEIKKVWQCIVVCGGAFPTLNPECLKEEQDKGVRLREICEEYGMVAKDKIGGVKERREGILNLPHIRPERLQYYYDNFQDLVRREEEMLSYVRVRAREMARRVVPATLRSTMRKLRKAKRWLD